MYTLRQRKNEMTKDEALSLAMHALHSAAWDLFDTVTYEEALESKTLREVHAAIQAIKKAQTDA
jgi:hypothetical protein